MKKTTTPKQSLSKAKIISGIKLIINKHSVLPILEDVYLTDEFISATDLENYISIPFKTGLGKNGVCVNADSFISAIGMIEEPTFGYVQGKDKRGSLEISGSKRKIKLSSDNTDGFPEKYKDRFEKELLKISSDDLSLFKTALLFTSDDDLRPAMTAIYLKDEIVSTDAHRLFWHPITPLPNNSEILIPQKTVKLMLHFGGNWQLLAGDSVVTDARTGVAQHQRGALKNGDGVMITFRAMDAKFPNYKVVMPQGKENVLLVSDTSLWRTELKNALKFGNRSTNQGIISLNGKVKLDAFDVDFETQYVREFEKTEVEVKGKPDFDIAFNMRFLDEVLSTVPKDEPLKMQLWAGTKAAIINDHYLLMPLMLNE